MTFNAWKVAAFGVFLVRTFPHSNRIRRGTEYLSIFSPNAENTNQKKSKYGNFSCSVSSGSEPVSMWVPLWDIHTKYRALVIITLFRVIISISLITTLESVGCYILLTACKVEMRVKRQLFWQPGDDVRMRVTAVWCRWVDITGNSCYILTSIEANYGEKW